VRPTWSIAVEIHLDGGYLRVLGTTDANPEKPLEQNMSFACPAVRVMIERPYTVNTRGVGNDRTP
jgi:hypothetical protein